MKIALKLFAVSFLIALLGYGSSSFAIEVYPGKNEVIKVKAGHRKVYTDIEIDAPIDKVWAVLTDFENMPNWSSTFQGVEGEFKNGAPIKAHFKPKADEDKLNTFEHDLILEPGKLFGWTGGKLALGMKDNHRYKVEDLGNGKTRFIQTDECKGGLTALFGGKVVKTFIRIYTTFNWELKNKCESLN